MASAKEAEPEVKGDLLSHNTDLLLAHNKVRWSLLFPHHANHHHHHRDKNHLSIIIINKLNAYSVLITTNFAMLQDMANSFLMVFVTQSIINDTFIVV